MIFLNSFLPFVLLFLVSVFFLCRFSIPCYFLALLFSFFVPLIFWDFIHFLIFSILVFFFLKFYFN